MARTDKAAPPRASPSAFARTTPVNVIASLNALAVRAASCPVIASTTNRVSMGFRSSCSALISRIMASSMANRPAVSTISTSANSVLASATARRAIANGCSVASDAMK